MLSKLTLHISSTCLSMRPGLQKALMIGRHSLKSAKDFLIPAATAWGLFILRFSNLVISLFEVDSIFLWSDSTSSGTRFLRGPAFHALLCLVTNSSCKFHKSSNGLMYYLSSSIKGYSSSIISRSACYSWMCFISAVSFTSLSLIFLSSSL